MITLTPEQADIVLKSLRGVAAVSIEQAKIVIPIFDSITEQLAAQSQPAPVPTVPTEET